MFLNRFHASLAVASILLLAGCGPRAKAIIVGSKNGTEQTVVAEIVAQHLENRLKRPVERRFSQGATAIVYQSLVNGQFTLYPEYTGLIESEILKEPPSADKGMLYQRAKNEMARVSQLELFPPLGYENPTVVLIRASDAERTKVSTLSQAASGEERWRMGVSFEFQQRADGIPALTSYKLPFAVGIRGMEASQLFSELERGNVTMITADAADSRVDNPALKVLEDDRHTFPAAQACLLVRQEALMEEPMLRSALQELSGKITDQAIRKLVISIDRDHRTVAEVGKEFLASLNSK
jgi:glycine betaine/choline ABC-type transport system substrate-binding protein